MGVFDAGLAAMRGLTDWPKARGTIDYLKELVQAMPETLEIHGNGLLVEKHFADKKGRLLQDIERAGALIDQADRICMEVLHAL